MTDLEDYRRQKRESFLDREYVDDGGAFISDWPALCGCDAISSCSRLLDSLPGEQSDV